MALTSTDLLNYAYYRCLPEIYRENDRALGLPLYRYLSVMIYGGYERSIEEIEGFLALVDPETCPAEFFPMLYESFGLEYYPDVDVVYHRKLLMNYGELRRRRGTYSCIRFLVKVLTGLDVKLDYFRGTHQSVYGRYLRVKLQAKTITELLNLDNDTALVAKFLGLFVPYYITTIIIGEIATQEIERKSYRANVVSSFAMYTIKSLNGGE